jgi:hypothetical protein
VALVVLVTQTASLQGQLAIQAALGVEQAVSRVVQPLLVALALLDRVLLVAVVKQVETAVAEVEPLPLVLLQATLRPAVLAAQVLLQVFLARQ